MPGQYVVASGVARSTPFDNTTGIGALFVAADVQAALEELKGSISIPTTDQSFYVTKQGNDTSGTGSFSAPFLTIAKALTTVTDSSPTKRYVINVGPGDYNENLVLKANVFIKGSGPLGTRITGTTLSINDATWNSAGADSRSGFMDITINPVATFDFTAQAGNDAGKLYFWNIRTGAAWTVTALNAINQLIIQDSQLFGTTTLNGMNTYVSATTWQSGNIVVNSSAAAGIAATLTVVGGRITGNITATWTSNSAVTLNLAGLAIGASTVLTASGASCTVNANDGSLPVPGNRSFVSSAVLNRLNDNFARGLLSATTNVDVSAATAPVAGQVLKATSASLAIWADEPSQIANWGDGSDGDVSLSSGTTTLTRTMYYNSLTLTSTASINPNGFRIYVKGTLSMAGTSSISNNGANGATGSGNTPGGASAATPGVEVGGGGAGAAGATQNNTGSSSSAQTGYGATGGNGGAGGGNPGSGGTAGALTYVPERVVRSEPQYGPSAYKTGGTGGAGGGGGNNSLLATAGAGGGGGGGGGVVYIFAKTFNSTSSVGLTARGGIGGFGGNAVSGNSGGGGGAGGGGGGFIYLIVNTLTALGTVSVAGGNGGGGGVQTGSGAAGASGSAGNTGHYTVFDYATQTWTVT